MSLVFDVGHGREDAISPRLVPLVMLSAWGTHLFGGSAEREGVAVQIGATISHWIGRRLPFRDPGNTFLRIGMAAGFAGLFRTPLAATSLLSKYWSQDAWNTARCFPRLRLHLPQA